MWPCLSIFGIMSVVNSLPIQKNAASIKWAHAVNDKAFLKTCLNSNGELNMLEADVLMGKLPEDKEVEVPIMAHPPKDISDLSLLEFVTIVDDFNKISPFKKGIKLDFKSIIAFESAIENKVFTKIISEADYPVWLNADILEGPLTAPHIKPVNAVRFLKGAKLFRKSVLSLGWTTGFDSDSKTGYSHTQIEEMLEILKFHEVDHSISFPVRAGLVAESEEQMINLLKDNKHTLTIWSGVNDEGFDVEKLNNALKNIGINRVYVDVPEKLMRKLVLTNDASKNSTNVVNS